MKKLLCLLAILFSFNAFAEDVVKFTYRLQSVHTTEEGATGWGTAVAADLSAYGLTGKKYLLTAAHMVKNGDDNMIDMPIGWIHCKIIKRDDDFDVAILECPAELPDVVSIDNQMDLDIGTKLQHVGCPEKAKPTLSEGNLKDKQMKWVADFPGFWHGSSGGPVFHNGKLFGIATGGEADTKGEMIKGTAFFLPLRRLKQFLQE